jgi:DNA transformation protein
MTQKLSELRNLGPKSVQMLAQAGIKTVERLKTLGAVEAYLLVLRSGARPTHNFLWALEGALRDIPWQRVSQFHRRTLLDQLDSRRKEF